ncbi:MAG TPA: lasso peptide biosynthesis B2 protein [Methylomirabilota bacterium]|nr:lasso peptide biosynthesis B2 protein [Methylomirabilota bacterium]
MTRPGKLLRLPAAEQRLLMTAALLQAAIRLGLAVLPYRRLRALVDRAALMRPRRRLAPTSPECIASTVTRASRAVPGATCLTQALAASVLLARRGHPGRVRVGVTRSDDGVLLAHAWVESEGRVVLGGAELARYTPLALVEATPPPLTLPSPPRGGEGGDRGGAIRVRGRTG